MVAQLDPIRKHACPHKDCAQSFAALKDLKVHKDSEHDYCKICDMDFPNWDELMNHRREDMHRNTHIFCKFCGEGFKSKGGRERHERQMHPHDQDIRCKGCSIMFTRGSAYIRHIETQECPKYSKDELYKSIQHKAIITNIMEHGSNHFMMGFAEDDDETETTVWETETVSEGGVSLQGSLLDQGFDDHASSIRSLHPNVDLLSSDIPPLKPMSSDIDALVERLAPELENMSVASRSSHVPSTTLTDYSSNPWRESHTSVTGTTAVDQAALAASVATYRNPMEYRFWDPECSEWDPEKCLNRATMRYICPFPSCGMETEKPTEFEHHLKYEHLVQRFRCPRCFRYFGAAYALVAHCESASVKCNISFVDGYEEALAGLTGGFLTFTEDDERIGGRYEATAPEPTPARVW